MATDGVAEGNYDIAGHQRITSFINWEECQEKRVRDRGPMAVGRRSILADLTSDVVMWLCTDDF
jgi:hypothetical protein